MRNMTAHGSSAPITQDLMTYRDAPYKPGQSSAQARVARSLFPTRGAVQAYLEEAAREWGLPTSDADAHHSTNGGEAANGRLKVRWSTRVTDLRRVSRSAGADGQASVWRLTSGPADEPASIQPPHRGQQRGAEELVEEFDHVIVSATLPFRLRRVCRWAHAAGFLPLQIASGRCNTPNVPSIPGLWNFTGQVLHSAWYRTPKAFLGKVSTITLSVVRNG